MSKRVIIGTMFLMVIAVPLLLADDLVSIPTEEANKWGARMAKLAAKIENPQVKINADPTKANGVHVPDTLGLIVVPQKELKESEELAAKFKDASGAALAYLFTYHVVPVIDGKVADIKRLRTITVRDEDGVNHTIFVHLLAIRQLADDDYRLYVYGADKKPLVEARFSEGPGSEIEPVAVRVTETDEEQEQGTVVVTVFGRFEASFRAGHHE